MVKTHSLVAKRGDMSGDENGYGGSNKEHFADGVLEVLMEAPVSDVR